MLSFSIPVVLLYVYEMSKEKSSFLLMWKGRAPYVLFLWILSMEVALGWKDLSENTISEHGRGRTIVMATGLVLPTLYVIASICFGLEGRIVDLGRTLGVPYENVYIGELLLGYSWPLSLEYVFFTIFFYYRPCSCTVSTV